MTKPSHITQRNGSSRMVLIDDIRSHAEQIRFSLNRMNGESFWAWALWRAPEGTDLLASIPLSDEYIQCAGSAQAMTIEMRTLESDRSARQYTVGRPGGDTEGNPTEVIRWDGGGHSKKVFPSEVFTADEAAEVFYAYFRTDKVTEPYILRELSGLLVSVENADHRTA